MSDTAPIQFRRNTYRRFVLQEAGGYRHARFKMVEDDIILTEGTPRAEYGPRAPPPHDFGSAGGEEEEDVEPSPAPVRPPRPPRRSRSRMSRHLIPTSPRPLASML